ncbi:WecB/TagA/CpsF family glycosyltransferase [Hoeflea sp. YIM 152468]|uniref:WecB/TagA/CpsF family glycosyltransferase n=1 Tax=Hoeflea sp. YIM 152468 TaxID=3031759 RepID=UPI0023DC71FC|nr:WecB/TagA/CpsF family glycosyltransferase [Hoeflea sp. YIM 152468]MDF1610126.1 WecB/TagA/CpsF family glycosyltransferase [Hoeflea sp. YIM 152468]
MPASSKGQHRDIMGIRVAALGWCQALDKLKAALVGDGPQRIFNFLNANNANLAMRNPIYRQGLSKCEVLPDGFGVDIASRALHGTAFPANLNGTDFIPALLVHMERPLKVALIGGRPAVLDAALANFTAATPWHEFIAVSDGFFDKTDSARVLQDLSAINPDITLVGMGSPSQEIWIDANIRPGHGRVVFGVGALFDFVSGAVPRAPQTIRNLRLEWLWRLFHEPSRLWRRYILGNPVFLFHVLRYKILGAGGRSGVPA